MSSDATAELRAAFHKNDAAFVRDYLARHPELKSGINSPIGPFDSPVIIHVRTPEMLDALLEAGADINARSRWWAGGFGLLDGCPPELADYAIQRGATIDAHSAARLGRLDSLREMITSRPELVHARGGDGQTPLHFARTIEIANLLLQHGADINARDVDHESTPAQYMVGDRKDIARHLVQRGCRTDLLMATGLGDESLVRQHLDADPTCVRMRVTDEFFPMLNGKAGGTIYQWTLGWYVSAHDIARKLGHSDILRLLLERSPADLKLIAACWAADETAVQSLLRNNPELATQLSESDRRQVALAARNNETSVLRVMLSAGLPVDVTGQHGATPLHWAAFHGNLEMARDLLTLPDRPSLELTDADFKSTPLGWAIHGSEHGWHCRTGNYAGTVQALIEAGASLRTQKLGGSEPVREVLRCHGVS